MIYPTNLKFYNFYRIIKIDCYKVFEKQIIYRIFNKFNNNKFNKFVNLNYLINLFIFIFLSKNHQTYGLVCTT